MTTELLDKQFSTVRNAASAAPREMPARWRLVEPMLRRIGHGSLRVQLPDGSARQYGSGALSASLVLHDASVIESVMRSGDIGFAQAYIEGKWSTDDLPGLLALLARNRRTMESLIYGSWWGNALYRLRHLLNRNSKAGSRRNIHAHYDLGNDFYGLWLDPSMTYSSALYTDGANGADGGQDLQAAQDAKYRRIVSQLHLAQGAHVLEIGCGWGGFAEIAAREAKARVTGLTLSSEQLAFGRERMARAAIGDRVELRLQDYREVHGQYDAIASIEMFEAVGEAYWPDYFECLSRSLKQGGRACVQSIVIADGLFERYRRGTDFIQQYIFPGGMLPSPAKFRALAAQYGLTLVDELAFGRDYARTLAAWRTAFHRALPQVRRLGFDDGFIRTWDFYLAYCEAGFEVGDVDVMQFTLQKP